MFLSLYYFLNIYYTNSKQISPDLFENKSVRYINARLFSVLYRKSLKVLKESLTINLYRYLIKYIIKTRIINKYDDSSDSEDLIENI